jgi:hypothetical protein
MIDGSFRDHEARGNLGVSQPFGDLDKDLLFPRGQISKVLSRGSAWSPRQAAHAALAQYECGS